MKKIFYTILAFVLLVTPMATFADTDKAVVTSYNPDKEFTVLVRDKILDLDVAPQVINGVTMVPIKKPLEALGFKINWIQNEKAIEITQGNQYTKLQINKNYYFKNKMAPIELTTAPVIVDGRTLVPIEFYYTILNIYSEVDNNVMKFTYSSENFMGEHTGYVVKIANGLYHLSNEVGGEVHLIISTDTNTIIQRDIKIDEEIKVLGLPYMTLMYPGQTGAIIIY